MKRAEKFAFRQSNYFSLGKKIFDVVSQYGNIISNSQKSRLLFLVVITFIKKRLNTFKGIIRASIKFRPLTSDIIFQSKLYDGKYME